MASSSPTRQVALARRRSTRVEGARGEPAGERVLLRRVVRAEEAERRRRGRGATPWPKARPAGQARPVSRSMARKPSMAMLPEDEHGPQVPSRAPTRARGTRGSGRPPRASACWRGRAAGERVRCSSRGAAGRRRGDTDVGWLAKPARWRPANRKSPERSPVKTRPVRLPPWAAGARPTTSSRARGSPKPGTARPQYSWSRKRFTFVRATSRHHARRRGQRSQARPRG